MKTTFTSIQRTFATILFICTITFIGISQSPFVTIWESDFRGGGMDSTITDTQIDVFVYGEYDFYWENVDDTSISGSGEHIDRLNLDFPQPGTYRLKLTPKGNNPLHRVKFNDSRTRLKLVELEQWGDLKWSNFKDAFARCYRLYFTATDIPDLSNVENMRSAFSGIPGETIPNMNSWDVSTVTNMWGLFAGAENFNEDISDWDVSSATDMEYMFDKAIFFNQPIGNWDVSNVTTMQAMFSATTFNQDISNWNVSNVENMLGMFSGTYNFNQDISSWDVSNVTTFIMMFMDAIEFNQDISDWDIEKATWMSYMFYGTHKFNQDLNKWDISNAYDFDEMFSEAKAFDQALTDWTLRQLSEYSYQTIGFANSGMSCENYSKTLTAWANNPNMSTDVILNAWNMEYSPDIENLRNYLIEERGWEIRRDSEGDCNVAVSTTNTENLNILLYPNPVSDILYIKGLENQVEIQVYDIAGRTLKTVETSAYNTEINLSDLNSGMYFIRLASAHGEVVTRRVIKQ